ncbi:MAG: hypothetical protein AB7P50_11180 [Alphaproteobacteria bacterium]
MFDGGLTKPGDKGGFVLSELSARWRIVNEPLQWVLQVRKGRCRARATGWRAIRFHVERTALIASVQRFCGDVRPEAMAVLAALPELHPSRGGVNDGQA